MASRKLNCWEEMRCGREPGGPRAPELGPCPAATDSTCEGINDGTNAGRLCWALTGTLCAGKREGTFAEKIERCQDCSFFRRVKYEEGCHFQLLKPGLEAPDADHLHRLLNDAVALFGICRDIFACLAEGPLLALVAEHALSITRSSSASAYLFAGSGVELVLAAHAGALARPQRITLDTGCLVAEAARAKNLCKRSGVISGHAKPVSIAAVPIGGHDSLAGVLELVKTDGQFSLDEEWFLREFSLIAALGIENARLVADLRELKRFDKAKSKFVAVLMHHISSPLATIACSLQALSQLGERLKDEDREKLMRFSLERINSIQGLSRRLLDLAAIRSGSSLGDIRPVCPVGPLRQEVESRLDRARTQGVKMVMTGPEGEPLVLADPDGLRVIFANLLGNAVKYCTGPVKEVAASVAVEGGQVRTCVRDTGIGIPLEDQEAIFEEFRRASNAPASGASGYGLGLTVVKELVDRYGGHLELQSTVGVGTSITVAFPLAGDGPRPKPGS